jgi:hypothetical protein
VVLDASLIDFDRAIALPLNKNYRLDLARLCSHFRTNNYRKRISMIRHGPVLVDEIAGQAAFVPPHARHLGCLLEDLYGHMRAMESCRGGPALAVAFHAMSHFLAIHPLTDGNGRAARALFIRLCLRGDIPVAVSSLLLSLLHAKYLGVFYSALMKYCLTGDFLGLERILRVSIEETIKLLSQPDFNKRLLADAGVHNTFIGLSRFMY